MTDAGLTRQPGGLETLMRALPRVVAVVGGLLAATGYAFGKRWKETGKLWGGHSWTQAYGAPTASGDLSEAQMAAIVQRMQQAAAAAHG